GRRREHDPQHIFPGPPERGRPFPLRQVITTADAHRPARSPAPMAEPTIRLLPTETADGPHNMAADEVLLEAAVGGVPPLRFYRCPGAPRAAGSFQLERLRHATPALAALPFVRRPSGGDTLVHHHELTYALGLPAGPPWQGDEPWPRRMHRVI